MKKFFFILSISFVILFWINIGWVVVNLYMWVVHGLQSILEGQNLLEDIYFSVYIRWILWADGIWIVSSLIFMMQRKHYKTDPYLHFLQHSPLQNPSICVMMPTLNEEQSIEKVVNDYKNQKFVKYVIVVDNKSTDNTVEIAEKAGAQVLRKEKNRGFSHSYLLGFEEALKTNANVIVATESDGTYNGNDISKLLPYLENCDIVTGSRQNQILTEKGNQNHMFHVWGNTFLAKLIQIKFFNLKHMGILNLTDVGCGLVMYKRDAVEKIITKLAQHNTDKTLWNMSFRFYSIMLGIENNLKVIEIPVTFNKRIGTSKYSGQSFTKAIKIGLIFLWLILRY